MALSIKHSSTTLPACTTNIMQLLALAQEMKFGLTGGELVIASVAIYEPIYKILWNLEDKNAPIKYQRQSPPISLTFYTKKSSVTIESTNRLTMTQTNIQSQTVL